MPDSHRDGDIRTCGATTMVTGQNFVFVNGKLWAVSGDQDSHGGGALTPPDRGIYINGLPVVCIGDPASADNLCGSEHGSHCSPSAATGDDTVEVDT